MSLSSSRTGPPGRQQAWGNSGSENKDFHHLLESLEKNFPPFDDIIRQMQKQYAEIKVVAHVLKEEYQSQFDIEMRKLKQQIKFNEQESERKNKKIKELTEEMKTMKDELERTKTRLSQVMGNKLMDNNPNIADLSDRNRPSKLAERLNELYDNEWSDAYIALYTEDKEEETILAELLWALMCINDYCKQLWKERMFNVEKDLTFGQDIDIPDYIKKQVKDCAKNTATPLVEFVHQSFIGMVASKQDHRIFRTSGCEQYIKSCVEVCWFMAAQDPPVVFGTEWKEGEKFHPKVFKPYTRTGDLISFVVWPPLYLQEGGPLLSKGVAQTYRAEVRPTGMSTHHLSQRQTIDGSKLFEMRFSSPQDKSPKDDTDINLSKTQGHFPVSSQQALYSQTHTQLIKNHVRVNEQKPSKYHQNTVNFISNNVQKDQTEIYRKSQNPTSEAENPTLVWNHNRIPTETEMSRFDRHSYRCSPLDVRRWMGDQLFELCNDFSGLRTKLDLSDHELRMNLI